MTATFNLLGLVTHNPTKYTQKTFQRGELNKTLAMIYLPQFPFTSTFISAGQLGPRFLEKCDKTYR